MFKFKIDVIEALREKGYTSYALKQRGIIGQQSFQNLRKGIVPGLKTLDYICSLLDMDIGDVIEHEKEEL